MRKPIENGPCCLCGLDYERIGNNPMPLSMAGRCCDACNEVVLETRMNPKGIADEIARVMAALDRMHRAGHTIEYDRHQAVAAICASRGPELLAIAKAQRAKFEGPIERDVTVK
ncbi:MAG TPA: hypothetical protein VGG68_00030 [Caulobacteraceae bacterium]|jgi:hypothetical protein